MIRRWQQQTDWPRLIAAVAYLLFAALVINHAAFFTMDADEAFNADIAKNWVEGYGYSSSLGVIFPFDAYISSGPAYTLLQAVAIALWGNDPDVQKPFIALIHLLLFASVLRLVRLWLANSWHYLVLVCFCLSSYALLEFKFWHRPAGELLSLLYFLNGTLLLRALIVREERTHWLRESAVAVLAGFLVACACLTKGQALLWVAGLLAALLSGFLQQFDRRRLLVLLPFLLAWILPVTGWEWYRNGVMARLAASDQALYQYGVSKDWHFFSTHGSGLYLMWEVESWQDLLRRLNSTPRLALSKFREIFHVYGPAAGVCAVAVPVLSCLMLYRARWGKTGFHLLLLPLLVFMLWAFLLNNSVYTHQMLPGLWYWILLLAIRYARFPLLLVALSAINLAVLATQAWRHDEQSCLLTRDAACVHDTENPVRVSLVRALDYLQTHDLPAPMANCGWYFAQDIEFALPGVNHIRDCMRLFDAAVEFDRDAFITVNKLPEHFRSTRTTEQLIDIFVNKRKNLFGGTFVAPVRWKQPLEFTFVAGLYMMGDSLEQQRNVMSFLDHCSEVLYRDKYYAIQYCRFSDLQAYVNAWGGLPIFTHEWERQYYVDFMHLTRDLRKNPLIMRPY